MVIPTSSSPAVAEDDLLARALVLGLAVDDAADLDVEHVDLAVDGRDLAVAVDQQRRVGDPLALAEPLADAAGDDRDPELAGPAADRR